MGVRILSDRDQQQACLFCSTSDVAFGPVFFDSPEFDADERAEAFLRWLQTDSCPWTTYEGHDVLPERDPRQLTEYSLHKAYSDWLAQEADQWHREAAAANTAALESD